MRFANERVEMSVGLYQGGGLEGEVLARRLRMLGRLYEGDLEVYEDLLKAYSLIAKKEPSALCDEDLLGIFGVISESINPQSGMRVFSLATYSLTTDLIAAGLERYGKIFRKALECLESLILHTKFEISESTYQKFRASLRKRYELEAQSISHFKYVAENAKRAPEMRIIALRNIRRTESPRAALPAQLMARVN